MKVSVDELADAVIETLGEVKDIDIKEPFAHEKLSPTLAMYKCNTPGINDLYIVPDGTPFMADFCTYKDDDFKFISTIEEEKSDSETTEEKTKEIFFEDEKYYYEFDEPKKDKIFVTSPAVRLTPEKKYSLVDVLNHKLLTIEDLEEKGLKFNKTAK